MLRIQWTLLLLAGILTSYTGATPIPTWLLDCYRGNETQPFHPNTLQALIEIIRKLEDADQTLTDIRTLSALLLHQLRLDGIERLAGAQESPTLIPFGVSGLQYAKFRLVLRTVSNVASNADIIRMLDRKDRCHLHRMMSSAIDAWRRNDEHQTCLYGRSNGTPQPGSPQNPFMQPNNAVPGSRSQPLSRCPIEKGAIRTNGYGPIAPGIVIASIAAGLQPQSVPTDQLQPNHHQRSPHEPNQRHRPHQQIRQTSNRVDNTYAASLAINLAQICMNQADVASNVPIGVKGHWNDTHLPRIRYLEHPYSPLREMTDSELLAGVDGLFLSQEIRKLRINGNRLRLSQVLDEYYSARGLTYVLVENVGDDATHIARVDTQTKPATPNPEWETSDPTADPHPTRRPAITNACHRMTILRHMKPGKLKQEIFQVARVLRLSTTSLTYDDEALYSSCNATVDLFFRSTASVLSQLPKCDQLPVHQLHPTVDLVLVTDSSRNDYENTKLSIFIAEAIDVSRHGSMLSIVDGPRVSLLVHHSHSIMDISQSIKESFSIPPASSYSLSLALAKMLQMLSQRTEHEQQNHIIAGPPQVALIFVQGPKITEMDFANAQSTVTHSLRSHPDLNYVFVTNDVQLVQDLFKEALMEHLMNHTKYVVIEEQSINVERFESELKKSMAQLPKRIVASNCKETYRDYNEAYVTPNEDVVYRIHPYYLTGGDRVKIQFDGMSHGTFTICMAYNANFEHSECQTNSGHQTVVFDVITCEEQDACQPVYFRISVEQSLVKCIERGCRHPDQIRFYIRQEGLGCTSAARTYLPHVYSLHSLVFLLVCAISIFRYMSPNLSIL